METYLASKNITDAQKVGKGTFVVVKNAGNGAQVVPGKYVKVDYVGSLVRNDSIFDKGILEKKLGRGELISGMEEGLEAFKEGGNGTPAANFIAFEIIHHYDGGNGQQVQQVHPD